MPPLAAAALLSANHDADHATTRLWLATTLVGLLALMVWDASGLDLPLARWFGDTRGFALRDDWWLTRVLHDGTRQASWALAAVLAWMVWRPAGVLRRLTRRERAGLLLGLLAAVATPSLVKHFSLTSCPWDLREFGGAATHVSHWRWGLADGGSGHCFPAGHASAGFAYVAGWFWLRRVAPRAAALWLAGALASGLVLGTVQQLRGAHYLSHTLWTAWLSWAVAGALWWLGTRPTHLRPA